MDPLQNLLQKQSGGRILDVATGHGQFLRLLVDSFADFAEAVGIDTSESNLDIARRECGDRFLLRNMDAMNIDYPDGFFDTVAIRHSLHHLAEVETALNEMKRVLMPGGLFIVCEVFQSPESERENSQRHLHHWWAEVDRAHGRWHNKTFTKTKILRLTDELGLSDTETIEYLEEYDDSRAGEILKYMIETCETILKTLRDSNAHEELIRTGEELVERFGRLGFVNESALYVIGRKAN